MRLSVVIGFRDWGIERLSLSLRNMVPSVTSCGGEVIVCDYASGDEVAVREAVEGSGARVVRVPRASRWSRSRALNAALSVSQGDTLISTDADMLFTPNAFEEILKCAEANRGAFHVLQCRDLPEQFDAAFFQNSEGIPWDMLEQHSVFRPRYGMGGMIAFPRSAYLQVRGFDERMSVYGGEDIDLAKRLQRLGLTQNWLRSDNARMYHIWHPSSRATAESTPAEKAQVEQNSRILLDDSSYVRNVREWLYPPADSMPMASIVIATHNRAEYLSDSVYSALAQTCSNIEVVVVDDGSTDNTLDVLNSIADSRLRVFERPAAGVAAARNFGTSVARGDWIAIHDDDDIMLPTRIEDHFAALEGGVSGTYGAWIDFKDGDQTDFQLFPGKPYNGIGIRMSGRYLLHGTLTLKRSVMLKVPYDETFRSGSDFNLVTRLAKGGIKLKHTNRIAMFRRLHSGQLTSADGAYQRSSWASTKALGLFGLSQPQYKFVEKKNNPSEASELFSSDLVSDLCHRYLEGSGDEQAVGVVLSAATREEFDWLNSLAGYQEGLSFCFDSSGLFFAFGTVTGITWRDRWFAASRLHGRLEWRKADAAPSFETALTECLAEVSARMPDVASLSDGWIRCEEGWPAGALARGLVSHGLGERTKVALVATESHGFESWFEVYESESSTVIGGILI